MKNAWFFWKFSIPYWHYFLGFFLVVTIWALYVSFVPYTVKMIVDVLSSYQEGHLLESLLLPAASFISCIAVFHIASRWYDYLSIKSFPKIKAKITHFMFTETEHRNYFFFQREFAGNLANKVIALANSYEEIIIAFFEHFLSPFFGILVASFTLFYINIYFGFTICTWLLLFVLISLIFTRKLHRYSKNLFEIKGHVLGRILDSLTNIFQVKVNNNETHEKNFVNFEIENEIDQEQKAKWYLFRAKVIQDVLIVTLVVIVLFLLSFFFIKKQLSIGDFALVLFLTKTILEETFSLANELFFFYEKLGVFAQTLSILENPEEPQSLSKFDYICTQGEIIFQNISFAYPESNLIFDQFSLKINGGEKLGIVGESGSGKSSIIYLLLRFFDFQKGAIYLDGNNIKEISLRSLRNQIGYISQDPVLFHRSIKENIEYGNSYSIKDIIKVAEQTACIDFIKALESGFNFNVGERGSRLSGGQRQRILLARLFLKKPPILILDEPTSSLDSITEISIRNELKTLMQHSKTTIIISHKLPLLLDLNRIIVIDKGKIAEEGTHQELISKGGIYTKMWNIYIKSESLTF